MPVLPAGQGVGPIQKDVDMVQAYGRKACGNIAGNDLLRGTLRTFRRADVADLRLDRSRASTADLINKIRGDATDSEIAII